MRFDIITIFPEIFNTYLEQSLIKKAREEEKLEFHIHDLRDFTSDKHHSVDDSPFGGGRGMVMKVEPIYKAVKNIKKVSKKRKTILFTPRGQIFNQKKATQMKEDLDQIIMICGRYEGVDERVAKYLVDEEISIGNYVTMGGELPALVVMETISRLAPDVVGKSSLLQDRITSDKGFIEYPQYTRPASFKTEEGEKWLVPEVLLSGNHKQIEEWRRKRQKPIE